ncbi:MAG: hypothetical protein HY063_09505 [Bacteroidetes bacterium]|nr:hypothetical protein [Bacteroidota bacterium]
MNELTIGKKFDFGEIILSEEDIIEFAKQFDPLDFHIDKEAAKKTIFKGLIASGPHVFNLIYRREWVPRFGKSVICGLGIYNWKFIKPIYANQKTKVEVTVTSLKQNEKTGGMEVGWHFDFMNEKGEMVQVVDSGVMHDLSKLG